MFYSLADLTSFYTSYSSHIASIVPCWVRSSIIYNNSFLYIVNVYLYHYKLIHIRINYVKNNPSYFVVEMSLNYLRRRRDDSAIVFSITMDV